MKLLKNNQSTRNSIKGKLSTIVSILDEIDEQVAIELVGWMLDLSQHYNNYFTKKKLHKLPNNIGRGDIVLANLGMNIHPELSDVGTDQHFVLIWGQQGLNFIVIPLTKKPQPVDNKFAVNLGIISGLPVKVDTYAKIDAIRSISLRRINRIKEYTDGKITLTDFSILNKISLVFYEYFLIKNEKTIDNESTIIV